MVTFITGFPGSGKSYYEVDKLYNVMSKKHDLSKSVEVIYTNINGIKFDKFPNNGIQIKKLNIDEFYKYLQESYKIYDTYKNTDNVDDYLLKHTKEKGYYNCLIAFDECHDFLSNQDQVKVYWLTYHRHLHHEIDLLTQNKGLVNTKYRAIPEIFIEAQPRSKKLLSSTLSYKHFASFAMRKSDLFNTSSIKTKKEVFELYQSGNTSKQKSILQKFVLIALVGLAIAIALFYFMFQNLKSEEVKEEIKDTNQTKNIAANTQQMQNQSTPNYENNDDYIFKIVFDSREGYFIFKEYYSIIHFKKFLKTTNSKVISKYNLISNKKYKLSQIYIRTNDESLKQFFVLPKTNKSKDEFNDVKINF